MISCPCCGSPVNAPSVAHIANTAKLSRIEERILRALFEAGGVVHVRDLINAVYSDDPFGGPEAATRSVHVRMYHLRRKLAGTAYAIETATGYRGYRLKIHEGNHG